MSSTNKTSLGLNMWEASDKPVRQDFVNDNVIIDENITKLNSDLILKANANDLANTNSNLTMKADKSELNTKVTGSLDTLTNVIFGRASDRIYIRFSVSVTSFYQLEIYDDGPLVFARSINGAWATMWTK